MFYANMYPVDRETTYLLVTHGLADTNCGNRWKI